MFDWSDLRHLIAVSRHGSTLAAAKSLGLDQSTVHRRLTELGRSVRLTLVQVLPPVQELSRSWYMRTSPDLRKTPRVAAFIDHVLADLPALRTALIG